MSNLLWKVAHLFVKSSSSFQEKSLNFSVKVERLFEASCARGLLALGKHLLDRTELGAVQCLFELLAGTKVEVYPLDFLRRDLLGDLAPLGRDGERERAELAQLHHVAVEQ